MSQPKINKKQKSELNESDYLIIDDVIDDKEYARNPYLLHQYYEWKTEHSDDYSWKEWYDKNSWCNRCEGYSERQCICYAR